MINERLIGNKTTQIQSKGNSKKMIEVLIIGVLYTVCLLVASISFSGSSPDTAPGIHYNGDDDVGNDNDNSSYD